MQRFTKALVATRATTLRRITTTPPSSSSFLHRYFSTTHLTPFHHHQLYFFTQSHHSLNNTHIDDEDEQSKKITSLERQMDLYFEQRDFERAIQVAQELISLDEQNYEWYMDLGTAYQQLGQPQQAIRAIERSFQISPKLSSAPGEDATRYGTLGECYAALQQYDLALQNMNQCISMLGENAGYQVFLLRAEIYSHLGGKNKEKHEDMLRAMSIDPEKEDTHRDFMWHLHMFSQFHNLLQTMNTKENARKTLYHLDECLLLNKDGSFSLYLTRSGINMAQGEFDKAAKDLDKLSQYLTSAYASSDYQQDQSALDRVYSRLLVARTQLNLAQHRYSEANESLSQLFSQSKFYSLLSEEEIETLQRMKADIERNLSQQ